MYEHHLQLLLLYEIGCDVVQAGLYIPKEQVMTSNLDSHTFVSQACAITISLNCELYQALMNAG